MDSVLYSYNGGFALEGMTTRDSASTIPRATIRFVQCHNQRRQGCRNGNAKHSGQLGSRSSTPSNTSLFLILYEDMSHNSATAGWERVEDKYYRTIQLYSALWDPDFDLSDYIVAGAPYGGALGSSPREQPFRC